MLTPTATEITDAWLSKFADLVRTGSTDNLSVVFGEDAWWRDILAFSWDFTTRHAAGPIADLLSVAPDKAPGGFTVSDLAAPAFTDDEQSAILAFFDFEIEYGRGTGTVQLTKADDGTWRAWAVLTTLQELKGHEEKNGHHRPHGGPAGGGTAQPNWLDRRRSQSDFTDTEPDVLVVGAGHTGLTIAARLGQLDVATLVVDRNPRVGDNWRARYRSLVLHDPVWYDHLPYLPFPSTWPVFTPKDKMGDWLEIYAGALDLNVWTSSSITSVEHDAASGAWTVTVSRGNGEEQVLHPKHVIMATGISGNEPYEPELTGRDDFSGEVLHSSRYRSGQAYAGKRVLVVGAGNSGHDVAQDLCENGAEVTMLQRSATFVISTDTVMAVLMGLYQEGGIPTDVADLIAASTPALASIPGLQAATKIAMDRDAALLDGLRKAGFGVSSGVDGTGSMFLFYTKNGGYYIDVGCSELIVGGRIKVKHGVEIGKMSADTVTFSDGDVQQFDAVILATGYRGILETARRLLGDDVTERCGPVWGLDDEGEIRSVWRESGQKGLWFTGGNLGMSRPNSKFLALQVKADLLGLR